MSKEKIYISGPISGFEKAQQLQFSIIEKKLRKAGWKVINPFKLKHNHDKSWQSYMRVCVKALCDCDVIYMLPGYIHSKGAKMELRIANDLGIRVEIMKLKSVK